MEYGNLAVYACVASRQFYSPALGTINNTATYTVTVSWLDIYIVWKPGNLYMFAMCVASERFYGGGGGRGRILGRHWDNEFSS